MEELAKLDPRQKLLGGTTLLLILVHMIVPAAGVDGTSVVLLVLLAIVLYGDEATAWLARRQRQREEAQAAREAETAQTVEKAEEPPRPTEEAATSELSQRIRDLADRVEHARVAAEIEDLPAGAPTAEEIEDIIAEAGGEPRAALMLVWSSLEARLRAATGDRNAVQAARRLVDAGMAPQQFSEAVEAFRAVRDDAAHAPSNAATEEDLWGLVDVGAALLALVPSAVREYGGSNPGSGGSEEGTT
ncbi:MAG: hypothetical protein ACP5KN_09205 [Armatimonadota bacterium]